MKLLRYLSKRTIYLTLQVLGVVTVTFFLVRLIPGNPALKLAGLNATPQTVHAIEHQLGLDRPVALQYFAYVNNIFHGDLGTSIYTNQSVLRDVEQRIPATLELVTLSMIFIVLIGIPVGILSALHPRRLLSRASFAYGMASGALADFWVGLILIFIFFFKLRWLPGPLGQVGFQTPPPHHTGFFLIDALLAGKLGLFWQVVSYLALPTAALVLTSMGNVVKITRSSMEEVAQSEYVQFARASGLSGRVVLRYMVRNALPPVITVIAFTYGLLLGGDVLVETVFSWGGMGSYAVQAVKGGDYAALSGFVMFAAVSLAGVYLVLDLAYAWIDPRIKY